MEEIWFEKPKKNEINKNLPVDPGAIGTPINMIKNRKGGCIAPFCRGDYDVLRQIKKPENKKYLIDLVNSECRR